jgi:hypothetical protein
MIRTICDSPSRRRVTRHRRVLRRGGGARALTVAGSGVEGIGASSGHRMARQFGKD